MAETIDFRCDPLLMGSRRKRKEAPSAYPMNQEGRIGIAGDPFLPKGAAKALINRGCRAA